jgi:D-citramalate synthase
MTNSWQEPGRHSVSSFNFDPLVTDSYHPPKDQTVYDGTLRKILVTPGVRPALRDVMRVAEGLAQAGVREVILNVSGFGDADPDRTQWSVARAVLAEKFPFHVNMWAEYLMPRPMYTEIYNDPSTPRRTLEALVAIGSDTVVVPLRTGEPHADASASSRQSAWLHELADVARDSGTRLGVDLIDPARMPFEGVVQRAQECLALGVRHLGILDSLGSLTPDGTRLFISQLNERLGFAARLVHHVHDDFGMASANAVAAVLGGGHPDVAVNGISYRSGHAALEQVVVSLDVLYGIKTEVGMDRLTSLSSLVAEVSGIPPRVLQPITGTHSFLRDAASGVVPILEKGPNAWPPSQSCFAPSLVGQKPTIVWGIHTSDFVIEAKLSQMGIDASPTLVQAIHREIRGRIEAMDAYPFWVTDEEMERICRELVDPGARINDIPSAREIKTPSGSISNGKA